MSMMAAECLGRSVLQKSAGLPDSSISIIPGIWLGTHVHAVHPRASARGDNTLR